MRRNGKLASAIILNGMHFIIFISESFSRNMLIHVTFTSIASTQRPSYAKYIGFRFRIELLPRQQFLYSSSTGPLRAIIEEFKGSYTVALTSHKVVTVLRISLTSICKKPDDCKAKTHKHCGVV